MQILMIPTNELKPDPDQPRTKIDEEKVKNMASNLKNSSVGIINPIEVDDNYMIITGEQRWRAATMAGLTEVPCKVLNLKGDKRFFRQVVENIHQGVMSDWDIACSLLKIMGSSSPGELDRDKKHSSEHFQKGIAELAEKIGKSKGWVHEKLAVLSEITSMKEAVKEGKLTARIIREAKRAPIEHQKKLKQNFIDEKIPSRDAVQEIASALTRSPEKADEILGMDFTGKTTLDVITEIRSISPSNADKAGLALDDAMEAGGPLLRAGEAFLKAIRQTDEISEINIPSLALMFASIYSAMNDFGQKIQGNEALQARYEDSPSSATP